MKPPSRRITYCGLSNRSVHRKNSSIISKFTHFCWLDNVCWKAYYLLLRNRSRSRFCKVVPHKVTEFFLIAHNLNTDQSRATICPSCLTGCYLKLWKDQSHGYWRSWTRAVNTCGEIQLSMTWPAYWASAAPDSDSESTDGKDDLLLPSYSWKNEGYIVVLKHHRIQEHPGQESEIAQVPFM